MKRASGVTLAEAVVSVGVATVLGLTLVGLIDRADQQTAVSEDYFVAEALAGRHLEAALAEPLEELRGHLPVRKTIDGPEEPDRSRMAPWPAWDSSLRPPGGPRGTLCVEQAGEGLFRYRVSLEWPVAPGSSGLRHYELIRFRALGTVAATLSFDNPAAASRRAALRQIP